MLRTMLASLMTGAVVLAATPAAAESLPKTDPLYQTILDLDRSLFGASNACDMAKFSALIADDLEFYHDKSGLSAGKTALVSATEKNICHKVRRELVDATFEVYPLANYGAMEVGTHTFCNLSDTPICAPATNGDGKFVMLWRKDGDTYKLARVISYDHVSSWERDRKETAPQR
jgi:hypothetical protein